MLLAAMPWTYWMALPLLVGCVLFLAGFAVVYLKKVVEPHVLRLDALAAGRATSALDGTGGQTPAVGPPRRYEWGRPSITAASSAGRSS